MTSFQITIVTINLIGLIGGVIGIYIKLKIEITRLQVRISEIEKKHDSFKFDLRDFIKENKRDHNVLFTKIDGLKDIIIKS